MENKGRWPDSVWGRYARPGGQGRALCGRDIYGEI